MHVSLISSMHELKNWNCSMYQISVCIDLRIENDACIKYWCVLFQYLKLTYVSNFDVRRPRSETTIARRRLGKRRNVQEHMHTQSIFSEKSKNGDKKIYQMRPCAAWPKMKKKIELMYKNNLNSCSNFWTWVFSKFEHE